MIVSPERRSRRGDEVGGLDSAAGSVTEDEHSARPLDAVQVGDGRPVRSVQPASHNVQQTGWNRPGPPATLLGGRGGHGAV